jgi:hypothetical protein
MPMTYNLANKLANATVANVSYTSPATVYTALYSVTPTANTSGTELTGNGYARQATTFGTPTNGVIASTGNVTFTASGGNWLPTVAVAITDASSSGNIMYFQTIATRNVIDGNSLTFATGDIVVTIA